jgi:hypothetical protein
MRRTLIVVARALLIAALGAWGTAALYYGDSHTGAWQTAFAAVFGACTLAAVVGVSRAAWRRYALAGFALAFAAVLAWWYSIEARNDRDWKPEVAVLPYATFDGNRVTVHNIRNFDYRSETDFTPAYYDKTFDLEKLESVDIVASYWAGPTIAHVFVSFGFGGNDYLTISIERRDEKGEDYSTVKGLFRQYELFYVVADERDVIRLRTNYRRDPPEDVYVFRVQGSAEVGRGVLREYLRAINSLRERPQFYNTLLANCTGNIWLHAHVNPGRVPYSWKVLASGYVPEYLYDQGRLDTRLPFAELRRRGHVNDLAREADKAPDFSRRIRARLAQPVPPAPK